MKWLRNIRTWFQAVFLDYRLWYVVYKDGRRTYLLHYAEAKPLKEVFKGKLFIEYKKVMMSLRRNDILRLPTKIKKSRRKQKVTVRQLAKRIGKSYDEVKLWEYTRYRDTQWADIVNVLIALRINVRLADIHIKQRP